MRGFGILLIVVVFQATKAFHLSKSERRPPQSLKALPVFDFSSQKGWEDYYKQGREAIEWHSSVALSDLLSYIPRGSRCLMVGCGNSHLPGVIYDAHEGETHVACLDSSQECLDQLVKRYGPDRPNMSFVCGDAVSISKTVPEGETFDMVIDKGLMDAIMCGDDWDYSVQKLFTQVSSIMESGGCYLLVSYRLTSSAKQFLQTVCEGLVWEFDLPEGNESVSVSIARKQDE
mmetsp:Transcript_8258/g.19154  ORF Transcript_8258/g.19154 Transcript_8258/m.19154 type:complete len:231 (-) Transcript_8258:598-1290(-)